MLVANGKMMQEDTYFVGIDGGGTHCRAHIQDSKGNILGRGDAGAANIMTNAHQAKASIIEAWGQAAAQANVSVTSDNIALAAGLAGANVESAKRAFLALTTISDWPFTSTTVISDLHAACLGAHAGKEGALIIVGTGSSGTVFKNGRFTDKGGYGFNVGDNASGAWLGREALKHTLLVLDGLQPQSVLATKLMDYIGETSPTELVSATAQFGPQQYGAMASLVKQSVDNKCAYANELLQQGARYIDALASTLTTPSALPLCIAGGLSQLYLPFLSAEVKARLVSPQHDAQWGAVYFAQQAATE
ncbi:BadF/BadG/BcrA/BcrD ATPase family protein [Alteromonas sp. A079]|uniref:BadF/BadG/BcrA/BcrD ATPase family protein n=1 Tax=Alteromonas sp. A079 TaxID=3410268 RepID=UPI003B9EB344